jgi:hypothetical protein
MVSRDAAFEHWVAAPSAAVGEAAPRLAASGSAAVLNVRAFWVLALERADRILPVRLSALEEACRP